MKTMQNWLDEYGESHQNPVNKKIHWVCVPAIMFSVIGLWWSIPHGYMPNISDNLQLNWAIVITIFILLYYQVLVEEAGFEPTASALQGQRSTN